MCLADGAASVDCPVDQGGLAPVEGVELEFCSSDAGATRTRRCQIVTKKMQTPHRKVRYRRVMSTRNAAMQGFREGVYMGVTGNPTRLRRSPRTGMIEQSWTAVGRSLKQATRQAPTTQTKTPKPNR
ncbi:hypothetical protein BJF86_15705 [Serinicoccus sp. CNJ-927]|nr:hypothetical protein BJF86_15705 [Serinicoccus sp. CNJ-927]